MRYYRFTFLVPVMALATCVAVPAQTPTYNRGKTPTPEEIRAWDFAIGPDGKELPPGRGSAREGAQLYVQKCVPCHGATGTEGPTGPAGEEGSLGRRLVGGRGTLNTLHPVRTVGSYWPFATTVWDYINRAMPPDKPGSLRPDEVYALTAFVLYRNDIIKEDDVLDPQSLPKIEMPNRNGFIPSRLEDFRDLRKRGCRLGTCP